MLAGCVIVAQPGLETPRSKRHGCASAGALLASLLALLLIVFVQPWTDSLTGLLAMSLPVLALAATDPLPPARGVSPTPGSRLVSPLRWPFSAGLLR